MSAESSGRKKPVNVVRIIKAPIKAISKVLDLYVKCVTNFSTAYNRPLRTTVEVAPDSQRLPRSFTTSRLPDNDQPAEGALVRSISAGAIGDRGTDVRLTNFELYTIQRYCHRLQSSASTKGEHSSSGGGMGKIDEDRALSFRNDNNILLKSKLYVKDEDSLISKGCSSVDRVSAKRSKFM